MSSSVAREASLCRTLPLSELRQPQTLTAVKFCHLETDDRLVHAIHSALHPLATASLRVIPSTLALEMQRQMSICPKPVRGIRAHAEARASPHTSSIRCCVLLPLP